MQTQNVFVSSTWIDMMPEREAVEQAAARLRSVRFIGMEHFGARSGTTREVSLEEVDRSSIYLGVIGHRWGSGITEAEYRRARERRLPCLVYFKAGEPVSGSQPEEDAERLARWKAELAASHTVVTFTSPLELAARIAADLHNLLLDQLVGQDLGTLAHEHRSRIQNFVAEYLGSAQAPVPFGGRERELAELDSWLADPRAPPYAMLAGPAGRGKSALLVHWAQRHASLDDLALIFFPISIRFGTNLAVIAFASITARLAQLHGEPLLAGPDTPAEVWREMMAAYLRRPPPQGRRLLLILDGADESADWKPGPDLFPAAPVPGLRVLVSARYQPGDIDARGWIGRLGWNRARLAWPIDLAPLSPSGLADVLRQSSLPLEILSERADVVAELFRLSGGDPLVIQLYVADLLGRGDEAARLRPEDLGAHQPGLAGYFAVWWEEQGRLWGTNSPLRGAEFEQVFNALACALGPLRSDELLALMPGADRVGDWALDDIMRSLRRFVVGDGSAQGYAFSHPRLAEYFYDILSSRGRHREQELRFVAWGRQCLQELAGGLRKPADVPAYLLQFLRPHFERAGCGIEDWLGLGSTGWAEAWERVDKGSWSGFIADLRELRKLAVAANDEDAARGLPLAQLGTELRAALFIASIGTQASEMPVTLLGALLRRGAWAPNQAIAYATRIRDPRGRLLSMLTIVALTPEVERPLALAAALGDLRNLLALPELYGEPVGAGILREMLRDIAQSPADSDGARHAARLLEAAARLSRQGLPADQRETLLSALDRAVVGGPAPSATQRLLNLAAVAPALGSQRLEAERQRALDELAQEAVWGQVALPAEALALLQRELPDQPRWLVPALCAATLALTDEAVARGRCDDTMVELVVAAWGLVPPDVAQGSRVRLATVLDDTALDRLLALLDDQPAAQRALQLEDLLAHVPAPLRARVAALRAQAAPTPLPDPGMTAAVPGWLAAMDGDAAMAWFEQAADRMAGAALDVSDLAWLLDAFHARPGAAWRTRVAGRALGLLDRLVALPDLVDALAALVDTLEAPRGGGDALEAWRAPPPYDPGADPWDCFTPRAGALLRPLLRWGGLARETIRLAARRVAGTPGIAPLRQVHADLDQRIQRLQGSMGDPPLVPPALGSSARALADRHATEPWSARELARAVIGQQQEATPSVSIGLLCEVAGVVGRALVQPAIAALFDEVAEWRAVDMLAPDAAARLPWPDFASDALLVRALAGSPYLQAPVLADLLQRAARLPSPTDELVAAMLGALAGRDNVRPAVRIATLTALAGVVRPAQWPRWLEAAGGLDAMEVGPALRTLRQLAEDRAGFPAELLAAVQKLRLPQQRLDALRAVAALELDLAPQAGTLDVGAAIAIARALPDASARLRALDLFVRRLPPDRRAAVLAEALPLTWQFGGDEWDAGRTLSLVRLVVALQAPEPSLLQVAVDAAVAIADRAVRGHALAALADVLPTDALSEALARSQRIADVAARLRTMRRYARACGPGRAAAAVATALSSVQLLPAGPVRSAATLYIAPLLEPPASWDALSATLGQLAEPGHELGAVELLDALAPSLFDAPAPLLAAALDATRRLGAGRGAGWEVQLAARTRVLLDLMPVLPQGLRLPALVQIAEDPASDAADALALLWDEPELAAAALHTNRLPAEARALIAAMADVHAEWARDPFDRPAPADATPATVEARLRRARSDVDRAATVRRFAMLGEPTMGSLLPVLAGAALAIGDDALRATAVRSLAVHAEPRSAEDANRIAAAAAAIEPAAESALALLQLARRQSGRVQEKTLTLALARAAAEAEPRRRLLAAVDIAIASPLRWPAVLELVQQVAEPATRAIALRRLLDDSPDRLMADVVASIPQVLPGAPGIAVLLRAAARRDGGPLASGALFAVAQSTPGAVARARLLAAAAAGIDAARRIDVAALLDGIGTDFAWVQALVACCARWPDMLDTAGAERAAEALVVLGDDDAVAEALRALACAWPPVAWPAYAKAALALGDDAARCDALCAAFEAVAAQGGAPQAPSALLAAARALHEPRFRAIALGRAALVADEPDEVLLAQALQALDRCDAPVRGDGLVAIGEGARPVADAVVARLLDEFGPHPLVALQAASRLASRFGSAQAVELMDTLPLPALRLAPFEVAGLLQGLAEGLPTEDLPRLLAFIPQAVADERAASLLLARLAHRIVDEAAQASAWDAACALRSPSQRAAALIEMAGRLSPQRQRVLLDALADTPQLAERARRLDAVRDGLDPSVLPDWEALAASIAEPAVWAPRLPSQAASPARDDGEASDELLEALELPRRDTGRLEGAAPSPRRSAPLGELAGLLDRLARMESEQDREAECRRSLPLLSADVRLELLGSLTRCFAPARAERLWLEIAAGLPMPQARRLVPLVVASYANPAQFATRLARVPLLCDPALRADWLPWLRSTLEDPALEDRATLLASLERLAPIVLALGGDEAAAKVVEAIADAASLWP